MCRTHLETTTRRVLATLSSLVIAVILTLGVAGQSAAQVTNDLFMTTYPTRDLTGTPLTTGPVTTIDQTNLNPAGRANDFSVRIEGYIYAATTGTYRFETYSDDGVRLFVNSTTVIDNWTLHPPTINTGTIDLVAGTWYPIRLENYERGGGHRLRLRWQPPGASGYVYPPASVLSQTLPVTSAAPLVTQEDRVAYIVTEQAARDLRANMESNQRANQDARTRHASAMRCRALEEDDTATLDQACDDQTNRKSVPLGFDGSLTANSATTKLTGKFFGQDGATAGDARHIYFGDFDVTRFEGGDVSAVFSARYARERMVDDMLLGTFIGLSVTHSDIKDVVDGNRTGFGLSAGAYVVDQLTESLTWDGFVAVGAGRNNLDIRDGSDDITGDYNTRSVLFGVALSGAQEFETFDLRPELSLSFGYTDIGNVSLTGGSSAIVDAGGVTLGRVSFAPDFVFPLSNGRSRFDTKALWFTPSLTCEYQDTTFTDEDCGGGLAIEWTAGTDDGLLDVSLRASREVLGGDARDSIGFRLESAF